MSAGTSVSDWVGSKVAVTSLKGERTDQMGKFSCILGGVDEYGIVVAYKKDDNEQIRFIPWHAVGHVHKAG